VLGFAQVRVGVEDLAGVPAGALEQLDVLGQAGELERLHARLAHAEHLALPSQLEVDLRQAETVRVLGHRL